MEMLSGFAGWYWWLLDGSYYYVILCVNFHNIRRAAVVALFRFESLDGATLPPGLNIYRLVVGMDVEYRRYDHDGVECDQ